MTEAMACETLRGDHVFSAHRRVRSVAEGSPRLRLRRESIEAGTMLPVCGMKAASEKKVGSSSKAFVVEAPGRAVVARPSQWRHAVVTGRESCRIRPCGSSQHL